MFSGYCHQEPPINFFLHFIFIRKRHFKKPILEILLRNGSSHVKAGNP